jgi:hypothetical protein
MSDITSFYQQRISEHGLGYKAMWGDEESNIWKAKERFKIVEPQDLDSGDRILDLGSGIGLLKQYLDACGVKTDYTAVDAVDGFLQYIKEQHGAPTINANFFTGLDRLPDADWYAVFGSINKKWLLGLAENDDIEPVYDWLGRCFKKARKGIFLSCFTDRASAPKPGNVHLSPFTLLERFGTELCAYRVRHDTDFYEFTLMARK